ncbi:hypothetical protein H5410_005166 [Solanum commersonii]|uniref:Uncharacterized protein n=1 Tax=Solanum commersonii TaxID=4109 RepID=A0A9J6A6U6_SOLCO|nr:hypothetical protein H5410_005166 [Solanum commersonii]
MTISHEHSCGNQRNNKTIESGFLARKYAEEFRINSSWGVKECQAHATRTYTCSITRNQTCMTKSKTLHLIPGSKEDQFYML